MRVRNATTNATVTGAGRRERQRSRSSCRSATGTNDIGVTATDPAGNENHARHRGPARVRRARRVAVASASIRSGCRQLPEPVELTVVVTDPDGRPLEGRPGDVHARGPGRAARSPRRPSRPAATARRRWTTTIPKGADGGPGLGDRRSSRRRSTATRPTGRSSRSSSSVGLGAASDATGAPVAATIAPCHCGAARTAAPRRPRRPAAGSATAPPRAAAPAATSAASVAANVGYCGLDRRPPAARAATRSGLLGRGPGDRRRRSSRPTAPDRLLEFAPATPDPGLRRRSESAAAVDRRRAGAGDRRRRTASADARAERGAGRRRDALVRPRGLTADATRLTPAARPTGRSAPSPDAPTVTSRSGRPQRARRRRLAVDEPVVR